MKRLIIAAAIAMMALPLAVKAQSVVASKSTYDYDRNSLSDPAALNWNIEECSHGAIKPDVQEKLAKLLRVPEASVRREFCRRILTAYARGAISYDDYARFMGGGGLAPSIARALRTVGSSPVRPQSEKSGDIVLPASAKMDSGEIFKGTTIASGSDGRFSVQSSRRSVKCSGSYDLRDRRPKITLPVKCSDGRTGRVEVTRAADLMSAWGIVKLSDGSAGRLTVGKVRKQL
ncbi:hypothetical protein [Rhizobium sp. BR 314]|uniref:hypothetical protein n=1 Tax=Rhizobium sp. BR 314 TaxID=3040013 RepID=UPI0039BEDA16